MDHSAYFPTQHFYYDETLHLQTNFQHDDMIGTGGDHHQQGNHALSQSDMFGVYSPLQMDPLMAPVHDLPHLELPMTDAASVDAITAAAAEKSQIHTPGSHHHQDVSSDQFASVDRPSSSEEKDLTSAQIRRKAQNRAAQRAFRERKERHVKELETQLSDLRNTTTSLATDNQRLKLLLQKAMTENEMLRATSGSRRPAPFLLFPEESGGHENGHHGHHEDGKSDGDHGSGEGPDRHDSTRQNGRTVITQNAVWDFLIDHPLIRGGHVDIQDAWDRVKRTVKNGVDGPVYIEGDVKTAIERSRKGGGDALI